MSLILKGIDMPKDSKGIELVFIPKYGDILNNESMSIGAEQIVEIPTPHGRLIDADELKEKRETMCWKDEFYMTHESDFVDARHIDNAPTILEAEE